MYCTDADARCYAPSGPYFDPEHSECIPDVPCGKVNQPCCQPRGFRDLNYPTHGIREESSEGITGLVCVPNAYCVPDEPLEEQYKESFYLQGTCIEDAEDCGEGEGKPCCIDTWNGASAVGDWRNWTYCRADGVSCSLDPNDPETENVSQDHPTCILV
jgi:hypothetical protein